MRNKGDTYNVVTLKYNIWYNVLDAVIKKIFWDPDVKKIKHYTKELHIIRELEKKMWNMTLSDIQKRTWEIKESFSHLNFENESDGDSLKKWLESIKHEAAALWLCACRCMFKQTYTLESWKQITWELLPYDVQIIGGLAIHEWQVAEMKTWEWKTLVATLPAYINALTWNSVHIVTVNDYLAKRDSEEMSTLYSALGLTTWVITHNQSKEEKRKNYACDVVYATNNELGFDYLRDNMVIDYNNKVMSKKFFAIVDEVDSILIDEARTPLIISMPDAEPTQKYIQFASIAKKFVKWTDFTVDEKQKAAPLTEAWIKKLEKILWVDNIYISERYNDLHHVENSLKANSVYLKDKDYIVVNDEVMIIDEHTGRALSWRRYSDGLHQALEAKEWVKIQQESKTLASITFQNYFRMYWKLAGMTGTAKTEEEEFYKVYRLETLAIPTNKPIAREDKADLLFKNEKWKFGYVVKYIEELHATGQPILVGTVSVEKSEYLSNELTKKRIPHNVLNAKQHEKEAEIVSAAGQKWSVTIATNMAGRGTDIKLWEWVRELWWLIILWTEKHETRRIDNQLRGRAGRQWDPGMTQFLISPNDDIMRIFWGDKLFWVFNSPMFSALPDDEPLTQSGMLTRRVTWVQKQVEGHHFDMRKSILEYDDVINKHREIIYTRRDTVLKARENHEEVEAMILKMIGSQVRRLVLAEEAKAERWVNIDTLVQKVHDFLWRSVIEDFLEKEDVRGIHWDELMAEYIAKRAQAELENIKKSIPNTDSYYDLLWRVVLRVMDRLWMQHINGMSKLREQVAFMWYAQKQPIMVYKEKAFEKFDTLIKEIEVHVVKSVMTLDAQVQIELKRVDDSKLQVTSGNTQAWWVEQINKQAQINPVSNWNPLFVQPNPQARKSSNPQKQKIRV